jgi:hypothetical protein
MKFSRKKTAEMIENGRKDEIWGEHHKDKYGYDF